MTAVYPDSYTTTSLLLYSLPIYPCRSLARPFTSVAVNPLSFSRVHNSRLLSSDALFFAMKSDSITEQATEVRIQSEGVEPCRDPQAVLS